MVVKSTSSCKHQEEEAFQKFNKINEKKTTGIGGSYQILRKTVLKRCENHSVA